MKLSDFEKNRTNPFLDKALEEVQISRKYKTASRTSEGAMLQAFDPNTGEILGHTMFIREIEVDEEKFTKVYLSQFESFWELSKPAIRVFGYIMQKMKPKSDKLEFFIDECMEYTQYKSIKPIYAALASLIEAKIIARGYNENVYFINPMTMFNGDRVSFVRSYVKKKRIKQSDPQQLSVFDAIPPLNIG
ncbi:replication/maintenance protein RepL [Hymenobacter sp. NST-14]|uniref:replication/maintenance protein RepL n=1 Tax=Hymenobacter piscis TaxID=2839984 RepID=UPI001C01D618|nr:replication/maintenance protein RepL [Hymenobacter piscis]MBT9395644.1 replication/maintenance protein RepL [Hymenobacter piscis]